MTTKVKDTMLMDTALSLVDNNLAFLLNRPKTKILKDKGTLTDNIIDTKDKVNQAYSEDNYNIALLTGYNNIVVIDIDDKDGKGRTFKKLKEKYNLPKTLTVKTPTGQGRHYYYYSEKFSNNQSLNAKQTAIKGVEIITGNKQITFANSVIEKVDGYGIPTDIRYQIVDALDGNLKAISNKSIANLSGDALKFITDSYNKQKAKQNQSISNININTNNVTGDYKSYPGNISNLPMNLPLYLDSIKDIEEGSRNDNIFKIGVELKWYGVSDSELNTLLQKINNEKCNPPLRARQVQATVKKIIDYRIQPSPKLLQGEIDRLEKDKDADKLIERKEAYSKTVKNRFNMDKVTNPNMFTYNKNTGEITGIIELELIRELTKDNDFITYNQNLWYYKNGRYIIDTHSKYLRQLLEKMVPAKFITHDRVIAVRKSLLQTLNIEKHEDQINNHMDYIINFKNCMYDARHGEILPHDKKYLSINQIDIDINDNTIEKAEKQGLDICPTIKVFLEEMTEDKDDLQMLLEYLSTTFTKSRKVKNVLWIYGPTNTGKSTLTKFIQNMVGRDNVSNLELDYLNSKESKFAIQTIQNKTLNISGEASTNALSYTNYIKLLTGDDTIKGEYKGGDIFFFSPYAKLIVAGNELPTAIKDDSEAFMNRLRVLETVHSDRIPEIFNLDGELNSERAEFIAVLLNTLKHVEESGFKISESKNSKELKKSIDESKDTVSQFINDVLIITNDRGDAIKQDYLYEVFLDYCKDMYIGEDLLSNQKFYTALSNKQIHRIRRNDGRYRNKIKINYELIFKENTLQNVISRLTKNLSIEELEEIEDLDNQPKQ